MNDQVLKQALEKVGLLEGSPVSQISSVLVEEACTVTGSKLAYFAIMSDDENVLTMLNWSNSAMAECKAIDQPIVYQLEKTGLWGDCVRERKPVVTNDYKGLVKPTKKGYPAGHVSVVRHLNVPMMQGGKIKGVLGVGNKASDYTQEDIDRLQRFANEAWLVFAKSPK
jgi:GAF domain-containing protein